MFHHILVALDGSTHSHRALEHAADMAVRYGAKLSLLHVITNVTRSRVPEELRDYVDIETVEIPEQDMLLNVAAKLVESARKRADEIGATDINASIETGNIASTIVRFSQDHNVDLIVTGRRGLGDLGGLMLGSVTHKISHLSDCACMSVV